MISRISLFFITFLLSSSCAEQKVQPKDDTYILFGHFYGFCMGEQCIEIFKLTDSELFEDLKDQYPSSQEFYNGGDYKKLDQQKFELVKSLKDNIPFELTQEKNHRIGTPDVTDGGGVYFAMVNESGTKFWLIDQFESNIPEYLRPFKDQINQSISLIND